MISLFYYAIIMKETAQPQSVPCTGAANLTITDGIKFAADA